jgi:hypothetical protein
MAEKTLTKTIRICDFCLAEGKEIEAIQSFTTIPDGKDVCLDHAEAFSKEVRLPKTLGGGMSGVKAVVDPGYKVRFQIKATPEDQEES